ncbi:glucokinase [Nakamurella panacisegetis]|uniref:Glucokinase n=1 Tax=Nakamurella panacisegetis TaxID=1090615 RepID=A0A1H0IFI3_9ACTN|nr:ROK family protein [Nakamurella panacisegetis]SDO30217.1 glucokinase [Nakamurella panacisegetis]
MPINTESIMIPDTDRESSQPLDLSRCALAVDIGGTKFAAGIVTELGEIVSSRRIGNPQGSNPEELYDALTDVIDSVLHAVGLESDQPLPMPAVGIATAAPLDRDAGTVSPVNIPAWRGFPLRDRLVERYGLGVRMFGDAVAVAVGEHWRGAARGRRNVLGMVVSTGIGGGVIIDGRVVPGTTGNAGHIGHISVDPFGPPCVCGGIGCLEAVASGTSIAGWARAHGLDVPDAGAVAAAARRGDPIALATFRRAGEAIGLAVAGAVTLLDLDVVVIGGGVAGAGSLLFDPIADGYAKFAGLGYASSPRVIPALLGGDAGLIGAAAVVLQPDSYWPHA